MKIDALREMPTEALLSLHNKYAKKKLKSFKGKKSKLAEMVLGVLPRNKGGPAGTTIKELSINLLCAIDYYMDKTKDPSPENRVDAKHKNAGSVGFTYLEIDRRIREIFPLAKPQVCQLRWYVDKIKSGEGEYEGFRLPWDRPRPRKVREDGEA